MSKNPPPVKIETLADRVLAYFRSNPEEEMFIEDIAIKFEVAHVSVSPGLSSLVSHDFLRKRSDTKKRVIFYAGPKLLSQETPPGGFKAWLAKQGQKSAEGRGTADPLQSPATIVLEDDVPLPAAVRSGSSEFDALFVRMKPGQSFKVARHSRKRYVQRAHNFAKRHGQGWKFSVRDLLDEPEYSRIWRTA